MRPRPQREGNTALSQPSQAVRQPNEHLLSPGSSSPWPTHPPLPWDRHQAHNSTCQLRAEAGKAGSGLWPFPPSTSFTPSLSYAFQHQALHPTQSWGPTDE